MLKSITAQLFNKFASVTRQKERVIGLNKVLVKAVSCNNIRSIQATSSNYYHSGNANRGKNTIWYKTFPLEQLAAFDMLHNTLLYK